MTPEIVTNTIVAARSIRPIAGANDPGESSIADAYDGLKALIEQKFGHGSDAVRAIDKLEAMPDSNGWKHVLAGELTVLNFGSDSELISAAQSLFKLIDARPQGEKSI
jgi:hypothetical protein